MQVGAEKGQNGDYDEDSLIAKNDIVHVFVRNGEVLPGDEDASEQQSYKMCNNEDYIVRLKKIGSNYYQDYDVD